MKPKDLKSAPTLIQKCAKTKLVFPANIKPTKLCIIGESLGSEEEQFGEYFVGKSGKLLNKIIKEVGLIRDIIHITNVIKVKIPSVPDKEEYLNAIDLSTKDFLPYLKEELDIVQPDIILALGKIAMETLTGQTEITKYRGSILDGIFTTKPIPILPTFHPAYLLRGQMGYYPYIRNDVKRFAEYAFGIASEDDSYEEVIDPSLTQVMDFLHNIYMNSSSTCFDIETVAKQRITCIGFTKNPNSAICIPFRHNGLKNRWQKHEQIIILNSIKEVYNKPGLVKIGQNMHYDMHFLLPILGFPREPLFDTMYAHALIHPDARHDLGFLTSIYTKMAFHKDDAKDWEENKLPHDTTLWEYNIKDVITTHRVYEKEKKDLKELNLYDFFTGYITPFRRVLFDMENRGMNIDVDEKDAWTKFVRDEELPVSMEILHKLTGRELNPNSSKQIGEYLESIGIPVPRTDKGNYTVNEARIEDLIARYPKHKTMLKQILCTRVLKAKDLGTYLTAKVSPDNHIRTSYGTDKTGRLSSKANHQGIGTNIQNQPKKFRTYYIPEDGHVILSPDLCIPRTTSIAIPGGIFPAVGKMLLISGLGNQQQPIYKDRGLCECITLTTDLNYTLTCTPQHKLLTINKKGHHEFKSAHDLTINDWLVLRLDTIKDTEDILLPPTPQRTHPNQHEIKTPMNITPEFSNWLGRFIGDGCVYTNKSCLGIALGLDVDELYPLVKKQTKNLFNLVLHKKTRGDCSIYSTLLHKWLSMITLKTCSHDVQIPWLLLRSGRSNLCAFLRGYFDADGTCSGDPTETSVSLTSVSGMIIRQVQTVLIGLGILSSVRWTGVAWTLRISDYTSLLRFHDDIGFVTRRKNTRLDILCNTRTGRTEINNFPRLLTNRYLKSPTALRKLGLGSDTTLYKRSRALSNAYRKDRYSRPMIEELCDLGVINFGKFFLKTFNKAYVQIKKITNSGPMQCCDYEVPNDNSFIADGFIVHNSQAEAFVFVYKAHAEKLKQRMLKGEKIHAVVANWMHDKPISELTSDQYRDVKAVVYSSTYGVGINKLATIMERSVAETKVIKQKYADVVPEVQRYHKDVDDQVNNTRLITNPYGRRRVFTGFINADTLRSAYSQYPQSTVVDTIDIGILGLWLIKPPDIYISAQVHDEAVISLPPDKVDSFTPYIKAHLETLREIEIDGELLVIPVDIGNEKKNWLK